MERIPRTAGATALALAITAAIGLGSAGRDVEAAVSPPAPAASVHAAASRGSVLRALRADRALRTGPVRLAVTVPPTRPDGRVRVMIRTRALSGA